jgi:hypothetical protein
MCSGFLCAYADVDYLVTNAEYALEEVIEFASGNASRGQALEEPFFIIQDSMELLSGAFLIKNCQQSFDLLQKWWDFGDRLPTFAWPHDQTSLQFALLEYAATKSSFTNETQCKTTDIKSMNGTEPFPQNRSFSFQLSVWFLFHRRPCRTLHDRQVSRLIALLSSFLSLLYTHSLKKSAS